MVGQLDSSSYLVSWVVGCGTQDTVWSHVSLNDGINWFPELYSDTEKLTSLWG